MHKGHFVSQQQWLKSHQEETKKTLKMAVSVHAQQKIGKKIPETVVQFPKFLVISKTGHGEFEYGSNVTPEVV